MNNPEPLKVFVRKNIDGAIVARAEGMPYWKFAIAETQDKALRELRWEYPKTCGDRR